VIELGFQNQRKKERKSVSLKTYDSKSINFEQHLGIMNFLLVATDES